MSVTAEEFQSIVEYIQKEIDKITDDPLDIERDCTYEQWKASRTKRKKKVEGISEEVVKQFEIFWQEYPGISRFEYNGKKFDGERVLKANKQVCLKLYNEAIQDQDNKRTWTSAPATDILKALQVQIANIKIESYKSGQNRMQYMKSCEVYLRQKAYEPWIGQEMPVEMKVEKVIENTTDM